MKAQPMKLEDDGRTYTHCAPEEATHLLLHLPGPVGNVQLPVVLKNATRNGTGCWSWNGDVDKPTLKPSLLTRGTHKLSDYDYERIMAGGKVTPKPFRCHTWITDGMVQFLKDTDHRLSGQTVELLDVD